MIRRKVLTYILTVFVSVLIASIFIPINTFLGDNVSRTSFSAFFFDSIIYLMYIGIGVFIYGVPVSLVIEFISKRINKNLLFVLVLYVLFGSIPFFIMPLFGVFSLPISILFFIIDTLIKNKETQDETFA
ncbi:hypothetical protein [Priestia koreensis]|uniref:hypothetical protein n=1 Tax=Priestia koreensis TaxID=284581 RepID=UPI00203C8EB1|nr:hypothetical protein [Priestia koreensis]MCM3005748.1 hypothetical protein [Priestia koreensis]